MWLTPTDEEIRNGGYRVYSPEELRTLDESGWKNVDELARLLQVAANSGDAQAYVIRTESGHLWLIESATDSDDALSQYYEGEWEAEPAVDATVTSNKTTIEFLRETGQASGERL